MDTGASIGFVKDPRLLFNYSSREDNPLLRKVKAANNTIINVKGKGTLKLQLENHPVIEVPAYHVSECSREIILPWTDIMMKHKIDLDANQEIARKNGKKLAKLVHENGLLWLPRSHIITPKPIAKEKILEVHAISDDLTDLHKRFGHANMRSIKNSIDKGFITDVDDKNISWKEMDEFECVSCGEGKMTRHSHYTGSREKHLENYGPFEYLHTDVCGPLKLDEKYVAAYFVTLTDERTKYLWSFPLFQRNMLTVSAKLQKVVHEIETQYDRKVKTLHMDKGYEYDNQAIHNFCEEKGIHKIYTTTADSKGNGVAERANRTLLDRVRTLLADSRIIPEYWTYALSYATFVLNHTYKTSIDSSPAVMAGHKPISFKKMQPFGQVVLYRTVHVHDSKLDRRGSLGLLLGPSSESYGYYILDLGKGDVADTTDFKPYNGKVELDFTREALLKAIYEYDHPPEKDTPTTTHSKAKQKPQKVGKAQKNITSSGGVSKVIQSQDPGGENSQREENSLSGGDKEELLTTPEFTGTHEEQRAQRQAWNEKMKQKQDELFKSILENREIFTSPYSNGGGEKFAREPPKADIVRIPKQNKSNSPDGKEHTKRALSDDDSEQSSTEINQEPNEIPSKRQRIEYVHAIEMAENLVTPSEDTSLSYGTAILYNKNEQEKLGYLKAYEKEIQQLLRMKTWENDNLIDSNKVKRRNIINSMFIFTTKRDGTKKCRLVARGDQQATETYDKDISANTLRHLALMTVLAIALDNELEIVQLDISSAYLYAPLKEELYIRTPPHMKAKNKVMRLNKSLYGLKQSGANWYNTITNFLTTKCNMKTIMGWPCVYHTGNPLDLIVCLFVDDMVIAGNNKTMIKEFIQTLQTRFDTKIVNDGSPNSKNVTTYDILGIDLQYKKGEFMKFGMTKNLTKKLPNLGVELKDESKYNKVPGSPGLKFDTQALTGDDDQVKKNINWIQRVVGLANYVSQKYRFDIAYYVNILAQHQLFPSEEVLKEAVNLVQYLWATRGKELKWHKRDPSETMIMGISDASYANQEGMKSQIGYYCLFNDKHLFARSTRTATVAGSTTAAELEAIRECTGDMEKIKWLAEELLGTTIGWKLYTDSEPILKSIRSAKPPNFRAKHNNVKLYQMKEYRTDKNLILEYIETSKNPADALTKGLEVQQFGRLTKGIIR